MWGLVAQFPAPLRFFSSPALHVRLGSRVVLHGVSVTARAAEVLALVGPNGAGKSTLLGALAADLPAAEGVVRILGRPASEWSAPELALRRAVLPQAAALSFPFTVEGVVRMGRAPWAATAIEDDDTAVAEEMARAEVTAFATRPFSALSGGERARAGDAVVVVLHDLGLAAAYAHRVAILRAGEVVADGPPGEVFSDRLLSEVYDQEVEALPHPRTGAVLVTPRRDL
ncbi:ATP-binding cassette domain-containing protein [Streptomyces sp. DG2A-72]|uniref:ATP-binding cassette domain-containing protein n=1 Tax=Streptomyces sp. DG2A-72 TaxID=3051386 RepID=UPI00265BCA6D|nr:ATP-binding cassette domain-containing protein [Streptomyces sp. DG2A-72]MDO0932642.1 ATP-binding cassette domain-containing protein [Streptomyces sp. DG2A-72]